MSSLPGEAEHQRFQISPLVLPSPFSSEMKIKNYERKLGFIWRKQKQLIFSVLKFRNLDQTNFFLFGDVIFSRRLERSMQQWQCYNLYPVQACLNFTKSVGTIYWNLKNKVDKKCKTINKLLSKISRLNIEYNCFLLIMLAESWVCFM